MSFRHLNISNNECCPRVGISKESKPSLFSNSAPRPVCPHYPIKLGSFHLSTFANMSNDMIAVIHKRRDFCSVLDGDPKLGLQDIREYPLVVVLTEQRSRGLIGKRNSGGSMDNQGVGPYSIILWTLLYLFKERSFLGRCIPLR